MPPDTNSACISNLLERMLPLEIKVLNVISANVSARQLTSILQGLSEKNTSLKLDNAGKIARYFTRLNRAVRHNHGY